MRPDSSRVSRAIAAEAAVEARAPRWLRGPVVAVLLETIIAIYGLILLATVAFGGIDIGMLRLDEAERSILILLIAIPLRVTLGGRWLIVEAAKKFQPASTSVVAALARIRVSPALADVAFAVLATRAATIAIGFIANLLFVAPSNMRPFAMPFRNRRFAEIFAAWDSGWYFDIARRGYYFNPDGQSSIAFFPLYPMAMRAVAWPFGGTERAIWLAGIAVSCVAFVLALLAVHRLAQKTMGDRETARRAVLYMAVFPFSLFFTRVYAESLFLLTSVLAVSRAHDQRWWRAGLWGALATLARPNGILIGLPLGLIALQDRPVARGLVRPLIALLPIPLALGGYCLYVYSLAGEPLAWLTAQAHWGYSLGHPPWQELLKMIGRIVKYGMYDYFFLSPMAPYRLFHGVVALVFLALTAAVFKRLGAGMGAYVLASLIVPLTGNALEGVGRYAAVLFPVFIFVGSARTRYLHEAILIVATLFLALFVCLFATGRPIY